MFPPHHPRHGRGQGAILCADWPGFGAVTDAQYFGADDLDTSWDLRGLVLWLFTEYAAGTPDVDEYDVDHGRRGGRNLLSELPMALLGRKNGALAVIGSIGRNWGSMFSWPGVGSQPQTFTSGIRAILEGQPVSSALRYFSSMYTELAAEYVEMTAGEMLDSLRSRRELVRTNMINARNQILLGDPAVSLKVRSHGSG
jgi:hypothetical protein